MTLRDARPRPLVDGRRSIHRTAEAVDLGWQMPGDGLNPAGCLDDV